MLLAPDVVVTAMEIFENNAGDTVAGTRQIGAYLQTLPQPQLDEFLTYFGQKNANDRQITSEHYLMDSTLDANAAIATYQGTMNGISGYDGPIAYDVPWLVPSQPAAPAATSPVTSQCVQPVAMSQPGQTNCAAPPPPPPPGGGGTGGGGSPPTTSGCSSYTDRFGRFVQRCPSTTPAYVFIHGAGNYTTFTEAYQYWGESVNPGTNLPGTGNGDRYFVSWDATSSVQSQAGVVRTALNAICGTDRPCVVMTHSAGDLMMGLLLSQGGLSGILRVHSLQSAAGGSELANLSMISPIVWVLNSLGLLRLFGGYPIYSLSLPVPIARSMYNHDATSNVLFFPRVSEYEQPHRSCRWYELGCHLSNLWNSFVNDTLRGLYNGGNDQLVPYHSSVGFRWPNSRRANTTCNPDSPDSPGGSGTPYTSLANLQTYYWLNHIPYHWQPPGQSFACRRGVLQVPHSAWRMIRELPRLQ